MIVKGIITEYHLDVTEEDVSRFGQISSERIIMSRDLTLTVRIIESDGDFLRFLPYEPVKIMIDADGMPQETSKEKQKPKRIIITSWEDE